MTQFDGCNFEYIPREENMKVYGLSKFASSDVEKSSGSVYLRILKIPSINVKLVAPIGMGSYWIDPIKAHLQNSRVSNDTMEARKSTVKAIRYALLDEILYKKVLLIPYLRCLRLEESQEALKEVGKGICEQHPGGRALAHKIIRIGFYWHEMMDDAKNYMKKCD